MEFNFLIGKIMGNNTMGKAVKEGLTAVAAAAVLSVSPASAEATAQHKINKVTCTTKASCEQLSLSIQAQIDELNKKIINSKGSEKRKLYRERQALSKEKTSILITSKDIELKKEKQETAKNNELIAVENNKQAEKLKDQNIKIAQLRGVLLDK